MCNQLADQPTIRVTSAPLNPAVDGVLAERGDQRVLVLRDSLTIAQAGVYMGRLLGTASQVWVSG